MIKQNYEFLVYATSIAFVIFLIEITDKKFKYSSLAKWSFSVWLLMHLLGGSVYINETRLYEIILLKIYDGTAISSEFIILKYDQFVHGFCYFVITLFVYSLVMKISDKKANRFLLLFITVLAGSSIGAINEIIEFGAVIFFDAADTVGGYYNTTLDLVFNLIGAIIAIFFVRKEGDICK